MRTALALGRGLAGAAAGACRPSGASRAMSTVWDEKQALRKRTRQLLKEADEAELQRQSDQIAQRVLGASWFQRSTDVGIYLTCRKLREVDTGAILDALLDGGRRVYAPAVQDKDSNMELLHLDSLQSVREMPPYGIREPAPENADGTPRQSLLQQERPLGLLLLTGQAFDRSGGRLGRGGGYYDKFIGRCRKHAAGAGAEPPLLAALAFEAQVAGDRVPRTSNDEDMDLLVLPGEVLACSARGRAALAPGPQGPPSG